MVSTSVPVFVISIDFEMFWGVSDVKSIKNYGANVEGVWQAVPAMLALMKKYDVQATWATVGMLMCKDYQQWHEMRPSVVPAYECESRSTYSAAELARKYPRLFFSRPLVEHILATEGQELASHTYSHFYCGEPGVTVEQFAADMECQQTIFYEYGIKPTSLVFPRNQARAEYISIASANGITAYRGNPDHWLYRDGHFVPFGLLGRVVRRADSYLPLSGNHISYSDQCGEISESVNISASCYLRPSTGIRNLDSLFLNRVKQGMQQAARTGGIFHLWWHPHDFGINLGRNLENLESLLQLYQLLAEKHGMRSVTMADIARAERSDKN